MKITVDHREIRNAANKIEDKITEIKSAMKNANGDAESLINYWKGEDFNEFIQKWRTYDDKGSSYGMLITFLESYVKYLRFASEKYQTAQENAISRASKLK